jgi:hypothetical protein
MKGKDSRLVAMALILKVAQHAKKLEQKKVLTPAERRRLLKVRAVKAVMNND